MKSEIDFFGKLDIEKCFTWCTGKIRKNTEKYGKIRELP